jgi:hypothetical protein
MGIVNLKMQLLIAAFDVTKGHQEATFFGIKPEKE